MMIKIKVRDDESKESLIRRFKKASFAKKLKFKEKEYFIKPSKFREFKSKLKR